MLVRVEIESEDPRSNRRHGIVRVYGDDNRLLAEVIARVTMRPGASGHLHCVHLEKVRRRQLELVLA